MVKVAGIEGISGVVRVIAVVGVVGETHTRVGAHHLLAARLPDNFTGCSRGNKGGWGSRGSSRSL